MRSLAYFGRLGMHAARKGSLKATPDGLDALYGWLRKQRRAPSAKAAVYQAERILLTEGPGYNVSCATRLLDYLNACGRRLIKGSPGQVREKQAELERLLASNRSAGQQQITPLSIPLYALLVDDLARRVPSARRMWRPDDSVDEEGLEAVAPTNGLVELPSDSRLCVIGDLHGDASTARVIAHWLRRKFLKDEGKKKPPARAVFLGDYVNNGLKSIEVLEEVLRLQRDFGDSVILLSGNHEFGETYATALEEFFETHWGQWNELSRTLSPEWKRPPGHYGHVRLDLVVRYGADAGEAVHRKFELWGRSLPLCAFHPGLGLFMSHSAGPETPAAGQLSRTSLQQAKGQALDIKKLVFDGYEAWKAECDTVHARMVNNRNVTPATLDALKESVGADVFVVGHTHYRSGDLDVEADNGLELRRVTDHKGGRLATVCSSHPRSADAGHYISRELEAQRREVFLGTARNEKPQPSRHCAAFACVAVFDDTPPTRGLIMPKNLLPLYQLQ